MKAFIISPEQVSAVAAALVADELGSAFGRHVDTFTAASWFADTPLGDSGAELTADEQTAIRERVFRFFGVDSADASARAGTIGDWAGEIVAAIRQRLTSFSFSAATDGQREFRHSADAIFSDAAAAANLVYGRRRILSLVSPHSLIGFTLSVLAPNLLQTPGIDVRGMTPDELKKFLAFGDALVATPSLWRYIIGQGVTAPDNAMAVFFGEPMTAELASSIRKAGFNAQREIYGTTEHGLIGWRDSPSDPFALLDHWMRRPQGMARVQPSGEETEIEPMDTLVWDGDRRFRLGGRRDGAVQIGAVNVFLERVAQKIAEHPEIRSCQLLVAKSETGADRLVASIVLESGRAPSETTARSIDTWCRSRLRPYERPRLFSYAAGE